MQISLVSFTQPNKRKNYQLLLKVSSLPTCLALQHCTTLGLHLRVCLHVPVDNSASVPTLVLASFVPDAFIGLFIFHLLSFAALHSDSSHHQVQLCHSLRGETARQEKPSTASVPRFHVLARRFGAKLRLADFWRGTARTARTADTKTLSRSRCLLPLDICPSEMGQDGWEIEGRDWKGEEAGGARGKEDTAGERESRIQMKKVARKRQTRVLWDGGLKEKI